MEFSELKLLLKTNIGEFNDEQIKCIEDYKEEAIEFFHQAMEKDLSGHMEVDDWSGYYAHYFLPHLHDPDYFDLLIRTFKKDMNYFDQLGDLPTESFACFLLEAYDDQYEELKQLVLDPQINWISRSNCISVLFQLYANQQITKQQLDDVIERYIELSINNGFNDDLDGEDVVLNEILSCIGHLHLFEYIPLMRKIHENNLVLDDYAFSFTYLYDYLENDAVRKFDIRHELSYMNLYSKKNNPINPRQIEIYEYDANVRQKYYQYCKKINQPQAKSIKVGRNDPCPCGSGKKYKKCCMNKGITFNNTPSTENQAMNEIVRNYICDRRHRLLTDPVTKQPTGLKRVDDQRYLEDDYDQDIIYLDYLMGLASEKVHDMFDREQRKFINDCQMVYADLAMKKVAELLKEHKITRDDYIIRYHVNTWIKNIAKAKGLLLKDYGIK